MPRRPSPATVIALIALFFAFGGSALAAGHYLINSTSQIRPSVLRKLHGPAGQPGAPGPAGAPGAAGAPGPQGSPGPTNLSSLITIIGPTREVLTGEVAGTEAVCPAGSRAVSGGGFGNIAGIAASEMESTHQSWFIVILDETGITLNIHATVECAASGAAVTASAPRPSHTRMDQLISQLRSALSRRAARP